MLKNKKGLLKFGKISASIGIILAIIGEYINNEALRWVGMIFAVIGLLDIALLMKK